MGEPEFWYRYEDVQYAPPADEFGDPGRGPGTLEVHLRKYEVLRHTPKGVWLRGAGRWSMVDRFVLCDAHRRFACPSVEEAKESFLARKRRQASIHYARAHRAEEAMRIINERTELQTE